MTNAGRQAACPTRFDVSPTLRVIVPFATLPGRALSLALGVLLLSVGLSATADAQHEPRHEGEMIVRLAPDATIDALTADPMLAELGLVPIRNLVPILNIWLVGFDESQHVAEGRSAFDVLSAARGSASIQQAQYNHVVTQRSSILDDPPIDPPSDPRFSEMWGLHNTGQTGGTPGADVDALGAWAINTGGVAANGEHVVIAIVDSGFDLNHPDIPYWKNENESSTPNGQDDDGNGYIDDYHGWNAHTNSGNITSSHHGTHVAGTAAARGNNGLGVTGVNWDARIMPIQGSSTNEAIVVAAYGYALTMRTLYNDTGGEQGAFVVATNASFGVDFGNPANFPIWCGMYDEMGAVGILSTGATMNNNSNVDQTGDVPTACPSDWLLSVTNTTHNDQKNSGAAYGMTTIHLGAPGTNILSTTPGGSYGTATGTSMAAPHVAGAIGLMFSSLSGPRLQQYFADPAQVALEVRQAIFDGTDDIGLQVYTGGRLNLRGALEQLLLLDVPELPEVGAGTHTAGFFSGTSRLVTEPSFRFPRGDEFSLTMWAQLEEAGTLAELSSEDGVGFRLDVVEDDGAMYLAYVHEDEGGASVSRTFSQIALTDGPHHIAVTRGGEPAAVRVHIDGVRVGQPFFYTREPVMTANHQLFVGNSSDGDNGIVGVLDEVRFFRDRILIADIFEQMHSTILTENAPSNLVAYYRFEADTTGYVYDFSNSGAGADFDGDARVASPFPVGANATVLFSAATPTGYIGPEGARLTAVATVPPAAGRHIALYASEFSDAIVTEEEDDLPEEVLARSEMVWGIYGTGDAGAAALLHFEELLADASYRLLWRSDRSAAWVDVTDNWSLDGYEFGTLRLMHSESSPLATPSRSAARKARPRWRPLCRQHIRTPLATRPR
jgi:subtilisin family serine protease